MSVAWVLSSSWLDNDITPAGSGGGLQKDGLRAKLGLKLANGVRDPRMPTLAGF